MENVAIIGASSNPDRYSYKAQAMLVEHGHSVFLVSPKNGEVMGEPLLKSATKISADIDTVTLYVGPKHLSPQFDEILTLQPKRIIFNPGTEDRTLIEKTRNAGIEVLEACTLVMLSTNQF